MSADSNVLRLALTATFFNVRHKAGPEYQRAAPEYGELFVESDMVEVRERGKLAEKAIKSKSKSRSGFQLRCQSSRRESPDTQNIT
jgi:hypothetical protein